MWKLFNDSFPFKHEMFERAKLMSPCLRSQQSGRKKTVSLSFLSVYNFQCDAGDFDSLNHIAVARKFCTE